MLKGLLWGIVVGILLVVVGVYLYFATGRAPVAVTAPEMPFERKMASKALHAYLDKLPHPAPQVAADEKNPSGIVTVIGPQVGGFEFLVELQARGEHADPEGQLAGGFQLEPFDLWVAHSVREDEALSDFGHRCFHRHRNPPDSAL